MDSRAKLMQIYGGPMLARCLGIVAELGIADHLASGPKTGDELATLTGSHAQNLFRVMRLMASHGIFAEDQTGHWHLTDDAAALRSDVPESIRDIVRCRWQDVVWKSYEALPDTVRMGQTSFDLAFGDPFFTYLENNPDIGAAFDAAMAQSSTRENAAIVEAYDFSQMRTVMDVAGGLGGLLAEILLKYEHLQGLLFEQPHVLKDPRYLREANLLSRCDLIEGDFFTSIPQGADLFTLKCILHDWTDKDAIRILKVCAAAMSQTSKLLIIDAVLEQGNDPDVYKASDVGMMALVGGRERTAKEFSRLYERAGLRLSRIIPIRKNSTMSLVEGVLA